MKGVIFGHLADMVEEEFGLEAWDLILEKSGLDGVYVSSATYPDEQLFQIVATAQEVSGIPANDLVRSFGIFMFPKFQQDHPGFVDNTNTLKEFLLSVDSVIHMEVRKLHPDANLPKFVYSDTAPDKLTMNYTSPRRLCMLAEGLIAGAAKHFGEQYELVHPQCMHDGADSCELQLTFL